MRPMSPAGYIRGLHALLEYTATTNLDRDPDDPYDPHDDPPYTVTEATNG